MRLNRSESFVTTQKVWIVQDGLTLLETLASVVVLSIFSTVLFLVLNFFLYNEQLSIQEQEATMLANQQFTIMAQQGALRTLQTTASQTVNYNGTTFRIALKNLTSIEPSYANGLVDVEVTVSWVTSFRGSVMTEKISLKQLFIR
ncbi:prepilin-type N-terminal cleavage/methylation domain-containing protein [Ferroacidibacillus organovorans]|uniref:Prepilin-type N-terminal cleavage/methylation domain-containing protein n=1 Tax=Ferroacidibacillus organovorans TaxID=1765683 RepID=A0A117SYC7_9BACL|nr:prepilin-type N-terminal cleavage/methylation domain-containing protein [Ferroacidibacillus organovorans]KUO96736.1 hypothetical protein ATW55_07905 [Ferroacidibacillus organovorans]